MHYPPARVHPGCAPPGRPSAKEGRKRALRANASSRFRPVARAGPGGAEDGPFRYRPSTVWAQVIHKPSFDPDFVAPGAVPWVLLQKAGVDYFFYRAVDDGY